MWTKNFQMSRLGLGKEEEPDQIANSCWIIEKARENIYLCFINYTRVFDCVDHDKLWKALKEMEIPNYLTCIPRNLYVGKKQQLEPCMEKLIGSRSRKEYNRAVCYHPDCLTYTLSTSWEMPAWMSYKPESR